MLGRICIEAHGGKGESECKKSGWEQDGRLEHRKI